MDLVAKNSRDIPLKEGNNWPESRSCHDKDVTSLLVIYDIDQLFANH